MLTTHARRLVVLLAALTTLVALAGASVSAGVALASAPHASGAQNRVRGFTPAVELPAGLVASQFSCSRPGSTVSGVHVAAGFCVATEEGTTLFRAVGDAEAADIRATGTYRVAGGSAESGKYFYPTAEQAQAFVARGWAKHVTSGTFPNAAVSASERLTLPGEGSAYFVPGEFFPHGPVSFLGGG